jgi:hypothetical protein
VDFVSAFGSDAFERDGYVEDTAFRTMSGAGHQHFLKFVRNLVGGTLPDHLTRTLFRSWDYEDPAENHSLRWDPMDDQRYGLRWADPSGDPRRKAGGCMWGANRLAIEALPLLPAIPTARRLDTTGFSGKTSRRTFFSWPIWQPALACGPASSLLSLAELQKEVPSRAELAERGVVEVYRSQRITEGKYRRNFAPARAV